MSKAYFDYSRLDERLQVKQLDKKLVKKDEVIAELVEHNIDLKKKHGEV